MPASNASRCEPSIASEGIHDSDVIELLWRIPPAIMQPLAFASCADSASADGRAESRHRGAHMLRP